jgi:hypothetical protein
MQVLDSFPTIRQVLSDKWAKEHLNKLLNSTEPMWELGGPMLYLAADGVRQGLHRPDYLERAEEGLKFILDNSSGQNRKDLIGELRFGSVSAVFEVLLAQALIVRFGEKAVTVYPRISSTSKKTIDFAVMVEGVTILIEAMVGFGADAVAKAESQSPWRDGIRVTSFVRSSSDHLRLHRYMDQKLHQRSVKDPLILCVNDFAFPPGPDAGEAAVECLAAEANQDTQTKLVGIAYFWRDELKLFKAVEARTRALGVPPAILNEMRAALAEIPCGPDRAAEKTPGDP